MRQSVCSWVRVTLLSSAIPAPAPGAMGGGGAGRVSSSSAAATLPPSLSTREYKSRRFVFGRHHFRSTRTNINMKVMWTLRVMKSVHSTVGTNPGIIQIKSTGSVKSVSSGFSSIGHVPTLYFCEKVLVRKRCKVPSSQFDHIYVF